MTTQSSIFIGITAAIAACVLAFLWKKNVIRPGSFPAGRAGRGVSGVPAPVWLLCAVLVLLAQIEGGALVNQLKASAIGADKSPQRTALVSLGAYGAGIVVAGLMIFLLRPRTGKQAGLEFEWRGVGRGLLAAFLAAPVLIIVGWMSERFASLIGGKAPDTVAHATLHIILDNRDSLWGWIIGGCAVLGAPLVEEVIYRAFLQSCLLNTLERTWPAIIGTSAIFAAMHTLGGGVPAHALPSLFVLSMAMGIAFERTRSIAVPMTMHVLFNLGNIVVAVLTH
ncbi:MAG TPA: type II CAAX endopeptidase family protein [Phycisphaerales bacterium]|nr:type II CAAX endopeptidase family protein [Phycisphaerales bacterium]